MKKRLAAVLLAICFLSGCAERTEEYTDNSDVSDSDKMPIASEDEFEFSEENISVILTKYTGDKTEFAVPAQINGKPVT